MPLACRLGSHDRSPIIPEKHTRSERNLLNKKSDLFEFSSSEILFFLAIVFGCLATMFMKRPLALAFR